MEIVRSWREQKAMLKQKFPLLSDKDFAYEQGEKAGMLSALATKLKKTKSELELLFAELQKY
jgi:hypothetical protein